MKIYVASSWKNAVQPTVVEYLRGLGHEVYDFRNPPNGAGFGWEQIGGLRQPCSGAELREAHKHPIAIAGYEADMSALRACDAVVYVLPCGRSASWEFGYAMGAGKRGFVFQQGDEQPELMFREATICVSFSELFKVVGYGDPPADEGLRESEVSS